MKRKVWLVVVIALVALTTLFSQTAAFARGEDSDNGCPPRSSQGTANAGTVGIEITEPINPPANSNAWVAGTINDHTGAVGTNPGEK